MAWLVAIVVQMKPSPLGEQESRQIVRGSALSLIGAVVTAIAGIGIVIPLARLTDPDTLGWFASAQSMFLLLVAVSTLGTSVSLVYMISRARVTSGTHMLRATMASALGPVVAVSLLVVVIGWIMADRLVESMAPGIPDAIGALRVMLLFIPLAAALEVLAAAGLGLGSIGPTVLLERIARPILQTTLAIGAAWLGYQAWIATSWALAYPPLLVAAIWWFLHLAARRAIIDPAASAGADAQGGAVPAPSSEPTSGKEVFRDFWSFSAPRALTTIVQVSLQRLDIVLVAFLAGPATAAVYTAATRFLVIAQVGNQALGTVMSPRFSESLVLSEHVRARALFQTSAGWLVLLTWPVLLLAAVFSGPMLSIFGPEYQSGVAVVVILAAAMMFGESAGLVDVMLLMSGRPWLAFTNQVLALVLMIGIDVLLIPIYGVTGAAVAWAAAIVAKNLLPLIQIWRLERLSPYGGQNLLAMLVTTTAFGVLPFLATRLLGSSLPMAILMTVASTVAAAIVVLLLRDRFGLSQVAAAGTGESSSVEELPESRLPDKERPVDEEESNR